MAGLGTDVSTFYETGAYALSFTCYSGLMLCFHTAAVLIHWYAFMSLFPHRCLFYIFAITRRHALVSYQCDNFPIVLIFYVIDLLPRPFDSFTLTAVFLTAVILLGVPARCLHCLIFHSNAVCHFIVIPLHCYCNSTLFAKKAPIFCSQDALLILNVRTERGVQSPYGSVDFFARCNWHMILGGKKSYLTIDKQCQMRTWAACSGTFDGIRRFSAP